MKGYVYILLLSFTFGRSIQAQTIPGLEMSTVRPLDPVLFSIIIAGAIALLCLPGLVLIWGLLDTLTKRNGQQIKLMNFLKITAKFSKILAIIAAIISITGFTTFMILRNRSNDGGAYNNVVQ